MKLWRLTRAPYLALDGSGPMQHGGRWTSAGLPVVNFATDPGLAVLVVLRYLPRSLARIDNDYFLGWTEIDSAPERLPFVEDPAEKRRIGDDWLKSGRSLLAAVRSVVLPEGDVVMMNPAHPHAARVLPLTARPFSFERCLSLPGR